MPALRPVLASRGVILYRADCRAVLAGLDGDSVDAVVTDPPYELTAAGRGGRGGFMGRTWDATGVACDVAMWRQCLRVLKPGGHLLAFGGTRTWHRMACAVEDAGFEMRDTIHWTYGSGFPKGVDMSKAIDKAAGAQREDLGPGRYAHRKADGTWHGDVYGGEPSHGTGPRATEPATDDAVRWDGWNTTLKPSHEVILLARKPLSERTVAANVLRWGVGALNVDGCRVGAVGLGRWPPNTVLTHSAGCEQTGTKKIKSNGNWTGIQTNKNIRTAIGNGWQEDFAGNDIGKVENNTETVEAWECAEDCPVAELDGQSGTLDSHKVRSGEFSRGCNAEVYGKYSRDLTHEESIYYDSGAASRFFPVFRWQAKAPARERPRVDGRGWPTVKPLELMRWLCRLVTPPGGLVLDPFAGSGTTLEACLLEGFRVVAADSDPLAVELTLRRVARRD